MYGAHGSDLDVSYVGIAGHLKRRIEQHLIRRDSSVTTGTSVVSLNPELVTKLH
jgi:predicted GIY-YIG superfamily endonuclease